ncbi:MAG: UDP-N-acetylglucosamine--N-acetylmuramyl-(pentapeptide) pyrophosphoryl-undecaprenol N-acetylglucosamine transferase [Pseudomonadota bacterium]
MTDAPLLVIAAGGTGGHMFPAQALAEAMLARGWRVKLSTDERGMRYASGFPAEVPRRALSAATFARGGLAAKLAAPLRIGWGVVEACRWFAHDRPAAVAGFGGYPALPALSGALYHGIPRLIHEQNGVLGRVNRIFAARVDALACGVYPVSNAPGGAKLIDMGNPIRDAARAAMAIDYSPPGDDGPLKVLIFGGSQGASVFATLLPEAIAALPLALRDRLEITQQVRPAEHAVLATVYKSGGIASDLAEFFPDLPQKIAAAHLVICRSGASTMAELAAIGRPSILIPYPAAMDDHQTANARPMADAGGAILAPEAGLTGPGLTGLGLTGAALAGHMRAILEHPAVAADMAAKAAARGRPDAAARLADLVESIAAQKG